MKPPHLSSSSSSHEPEEEEDEGAYASHTQHHHSVPHHHHQLHHPHPPPLPHWSLSQLDDQHGQQDEPEHEDFDHVNAASGRATNGNADTKSRKSKREVFICPEVHCGKQFPRSFALRRHMRIHTGTKPYVCDHEGCPQKFNTSGNLSRHKRIHSGERPYPCVYHNCGKRFNTSTKLKRHMRIHFPDGQNLFQCTDISCSWACDNYKEYVQHLKLHSSVANGGNGKPQDENINRSNTTKKTTTSSTTKSSATYSRRTAEFRPPPSSTTQSSLPGDTHPASSFSAKEYESHRAFESTSAPVALAMMHKDQHMQKELGLDHEFAENQRARHHYDERPRLPFPTQAFPSESIAAASAGIGSSFPHHHHHHPFNHHNHHSPHHHHGTNHRAPYYEHSSNYSPSTNYGGAYSYLRGAQDGYSNNNHHQNQQPHHSYHPQDSHHYAPIRSEEDDYEATSPQSMRSSQQSESGKYEYTSSNINSTTGPEFTGEELSAVLELMKDS